MIAPCVADYVVKPSCWNSTFRRENNHFTTNNSCRKRNMFDRKSLIILRYDGIILGVFGAQTSEASRTLCKLHCIPCSSLRGHSRSYIFVPIESSCTTSYCPLIVTFALSSTVSEIIIACFVRPEPIFPYPTPILAKIWGE